MTAQAFHPCGTNDPSQHNLTLHMNSLLDALLFRVYHKGTGMD